MKYALAVAPVWVLASVFTFTACKTAWVSSTVQSDFTGVEQTWQPGDIIKIVLEPNNFHDIDHARVAFTGPVEMVPFQSMRKTASHLEMIFEVPRHSKFDQALLAFEIFDKVGNRTIVFPTAQSFKKAGLDVLDFDNDGLGDADSNTQFVSYDAPAIIGMAFDEVAPELISARLTAIAPQEGLVEFVVKDEGLVTAEIEIGMETALPDGRRLRRTVAKTSDEYQSFCSRKTDQLLNCRTRLKMPKQMRHAPYMRITLRDLQGHEVVGDSTVDKDKIAASWSTNPRMDDSPISVTAVKVLHQAATLLQIRVESQGGAGISDLEMVVGADIDLRTLRPRSLKCAGAVCTAAFVSPHLNMRQNLPVADVRVYGVNGTTAVSQPIAGINFQLMNGQQAAPKVARITFEKASKRELLSFSQ